MLCPQCGGLTHRSHTRGFDERLVKGLTSYKTFRCHECGWRGWLRGSGGSSKRRYKVRTVISILVTLLITTILALYVVEKLSLPGPGAGSEQETPR